MKKIIFLFIAVLSYHITYAQQYEIVESIYDIGNSNNSSNYRSIGGYNNYGNSTHYQQAPQTPQPQNVRANAIGKDHFSDSYVKVPIIVSIQGQSVKVTKYYADDNWHSIPYGASVEKCSSLNAKFNPLEGQYMYKANVHISSTISRYTIMGNIYFDL